MPTGGMAEAYVDKRARSALGEREMFANPPAEAGVYEESAKAD